MKLLLTLSLSFLLLFMVGCPAPATDTDKKNETNKGVKKDDKAEKKDDKADDKMKNGENPKVGGAEMLKDKNIVENASNSPEHKTLVSAVKQAGLVETLSGKGPFTVFAPTDAAFGKVDKATLEGLMKNDNKDKLKGILTYHVVAGKLDAKAVAEAIKKGDGKAVLKTVNGAEITAAMDGDKVVITDAAGGKSTVTVADVMQSNGVIHVVDAVMMPSK